MLETKVHEFLCQKYDEYGAAGERIVSYVDELYTKCGPLLDDQFVTEFCTYNEEQFTQRFWELFLANYLIDGSYEPERSKPGRPDLSFNCAGRRVWIEATAPSAGTGKNALPARYLSSQWSKGRFNVYTVPFETILLRWTTVIAEKCRKYDAYRRNGVVSDSEPYVIAINAHQLGHAGFHGVSQLPAAVEAVYPAGPITVRIDKESLEVVDSSLAFRPTVWNQNEAPISTTLFLDRSYSGVSGILAASVSPEGVATGYFQGLVYVRNIYARNPVDINLDGITEFWVEQLGLDTLVIRRSDQGNRPKPFP